MPKGKKGKRKHKERNIPSHGGHGSAKFTTRKSRGNETQVEAYVKRGHLIVESKPRPAPRRKGDGRKT